MELAGMEYLKTLVVTHPSMVEKEVVENPVDQTTGIEIVEHMKKTQHADKECVGEVR